MDPLKFDVFAISNPVLPPVGSSDFVSLLDDDSNAVTIMNLTRAEVAGIFAVLDHAVNMVSAYPSGWPAVDFHSPDKHIRFQVSSYPDDTFLTLSIDGCHIREGGLAGDYCHDFEIESITFEDWGKLKALIAG